MKSLTPLLLAMAIAALTLTACGEKQTDAAATPNETGKSGQAVAPNSPPTATQDAQAANGEHLGKAIHDA
ncbi:MAG: hypothetical protein WBM66_01540, partial [Thiothrix litoralis]